MSHTILHALFYTNRNGRYKKRPTIIFAFEPMLKMSQAISHSAQNYASVLITVNLVLCLATDLSQCFRKILQFVLEKINKSAKHLL